MSASGDKTSSSNCVFELLSDYADGLLDDEQSRELLDLLRRDPEARAALIENAILASLLRSKARQNIGSLNEIDPFVDVCSFARLMVKLPFQSGEVSNFQSLTANPSPMIPPIIIGTSAFAPPPPPGFLNTAYHGSVNFFSQDVPFACLMSTLIVGFALVIASFVTKEHYTQMPGRSVASAERSYTAPESVGAGKARAAAAVKEQEEVMQLVGRITGMVDCKWAAPGRTFSSSTDYLVALHDKYSLTSGLMEITYNTGAKVILQGPCTYEVDSVAGGYLSLGKLTARVENKGAGEEKVQGSMSNVQDSTSHSLNLKPLALNLPSSPQPLAPSPLFAVRTPTAVVTDLGTEFGVEVRADKSSEIYVIRGMVEAVRDSRTGGVPVRERLVAGEGIQFISLDGPPQRMAAGSVPSSSLNLNHKFLRKIVAARQGKLPLSPAMLVASSYHRIWDPQGKLAARDDRQLAFQMVTDGIFGRGENGEGPRSSFDTGEAVASGQWPVASEKAKDRNQSPAPATSHQPLATSFVGLLYDRTVRIDRIKVFLGCQRGDGGSWAEMPRIFLLKQLADTNETPPENDPSRWQELPRHLLYGANCSAEPDPNPGEVIEIVLTNLSEEDRTGFGWALGGVRGDGSAGYLSITELRAYGLANPAKRKGDEP